MNIWICSGTALARKLQTHMDLLVRLIKSYLVPICTAFKLLFWFNLTGQFFRKEVAIDEVRKILILPGKEPVPVMRRPVWSFMEREVADDQLCWTAMNPGYQGEGLIDGTYFDYLVNDVLSTEFKFKKQ